MHKAWSLQSLGDVFPREEGEGEGEGEEEGVLQISSDRDDQMGLKIKTQKNPMASNTYENRCNVMR